MLISGVIRVGKYSHKNEADSRQTYRSRTSRKEGIKQQIACGSGTRIKAEITVNSKWARANIGALLFPAKPQPADARIFDDDM